MFQQYPLVILIIKLYANLNSATSVLRPSIYSANSINSSNSFNDLYPTTEVFDKLKSATFFERRKSCRVLRPSDISVLSRIISKITTSILISMNLKLASFMTTLFEVVHSTFSFWYLVLHRI